MATSRDEAAEGDAEFSRLYRAHARDIRAFALYLSGEPALADDLVSEAFARAWTTRDRIRFSTVRGYLYAIVRNLFLQHRRRAWRRQPLDEQLVDDRPGPERIVAEQDRLRLVMQALAGLPEIDRAAVLLRADEGLAYEEIALVLGISVASAKVKVHRARLKLADLSPAGTEPEQDRGRNP